MWLLLKYSFLMIIHNRDRSMIKLFRAVIMLPFISAPAQRPNHSFILTAPIHPQANTRPLHLFVLFPSRHISEL